MRYVDLRSDTVTQPTPEMREAIYRAAVGDDVFSDDPTVQKLEALAADMFDKEAALFVTSGTQGNAVCMMTHTRRGDAIIVGRGCHITDHEAGAYAVLSGVSPCYAKTENGMLDPQSVKELIVDDSELQIARTGLICLENAYSDGRVGSLLNMRAIYQTARAKNVPVHLDGARLFNAAAVLGVSVRELTACCDTVMCCLSKGLCAPVGSVVAGSREFIQKARKNRKLLGGGMRQAGFLAAAGLLALQEMPARLPQDHENARYLADALAQIPCLQVARERVQINMVFFTADWNEAACAAFPLWLLEKGFKVTGRSDGEFRLVTNKDVSRADCTALAGAIAQFASERESGQAGGRAL